MKPLLTVVVIAASMAFAGPVVAQKGKPAAVAPLQVYNAAGHAIGHYIGESKFSSVQEGTRVDAWFIYWIPEDQIWGPAVYFETADCTGIAYQTAFAGSLHRSGWLFPNGVLIYPSAGATKLILGGSQRYTNSQGEVAGQCYSLAGAQMEAAELKAVNVGAGPYTVK
jgi:uncharacterized protein YfaT (DUF1175 family)